MELIDHHICFTDRPAPAYTDRFWEVRQMMEEWRRNMKEFFYPSWILCLDKSMSIWMSKYTCPGWVFCPRKPHPFGNEYHTICCAESGILFDFEIVEGNDHPCDMPPVEFSNTGKTAGLLLRLTKSVHHSARYVVLDSGFCVLQALVELQKVGVFAGALIKKRRFWPALVPGNVIDQHFDGKEVGSVNSVGGSLDGVKYNIWAMKDAGYVAKIMGTASGLIYREERQHYREVDGRRVQFKYTEPFSLHYAYRHLIDDHNNKRHAVPLIEGTLRTQRWAMRVFQYCIATSEVNMFLGQKHFVWDGDKKQTVLDFCRDLAWELILNPCHVVNPQKQRTSKWLRSNIIMHKRAKCPPFTSHWDGTIFVIGASHKYNQFTCKSHGFKKWVHTYCVCNPGWWMCEDHWRNHFLERVVSDERDD